MEYPIYIEVPEDYWVVTTTAEIDDDSDHLDFEPTPEDD